MTLPLRHRDGDDSMPPAAALAAVEQMAPDREQLEKMRPAVQLTGVRSGTAKGRYIPQCGGTYRPFGLMAPE
ncbi:hypothetical protein [Streptomyces decoyicus]|uniref:hypothetical protein n=1 Tax=Streptomyces decoyicus TaxID=249567 RepID=UPI00386D1A22|nr:hypothetical protein OG532_08160 [Streptomyces decoyicus]